MDSLVLHVELGTSVVYYYTLYSLGCLSPLILTNHSSDWESVVSCVLVS